MKQPDTDQATKNAKSLTNILCILSMLEKAFDRLVRMNYNRRSQYPEIVVEIAHRSISFVKRSEINISK